MTTFDEVPVLEINTENFYQLWPTLVAAIKSATFLAVDCELSGLGERKQLFAKDMAVRYEGMKKTAQSRAIISLGLSCFSVQPVVQARSENKHTAKSISFLVQTFNILVLCSENFTVEPLSLKFLLQHGFDFNKQYAYGIPYYRGSDKRDEKGNSLRKLFSEIVCSGVPLVVHNGPVDLVFLYHSFYGSLPSSVDTFLADLSDIFSGGVYDTKYIAEYKARFSASYLEYVFRKCQRVNNACENADLPCVRLLFPPYPRQVPHIVWLPCGLQSSTQHQSPCKHFSAHGWCEKQDKCAHSHNIDVILDKEEQITAKKRKRRTKNSETTKMSSCEDSEEDSGSEDSSVCPDSSTDIKKSALPKMAGHRAGFDAFMTGLSFAYFVAKYGSYDDIDAKQRLLEFGVSEFINKVALSGKDIPLQITKSTFAKTSKEHREKIRRLKETKDVVLLSS